jgi:hypothetical protein
MNLEHKRNVKVNLSADEWGIPSKIDRAGFEESLSPALARWETLDRDGCAAEVNKAMMEAIASSATRQEAWDKMEDTLDKLFGSHAAVFCCVARILNDVFIEYEHVHDESGRLLWTQPYHSSNPSIEGEGVSFCHEGRWYISVSAYYEENGNMRTVVKDLSAELLWHRPERTKSQAAMSPPRGERRMRSRCPHAKDACQSNWNVSRPRQRRALRRWRLETKFCGNAVETAPI